MEDLWKHMTIVALLAIPLINKLSTSLTTSAMSRDLMFLFLQFQTHVLRQRRDADSFVTIFFTSITSVQPHWLGPVVFILMVV
jgi:hypothetical protein